jgi:hypothetical protein
MTKKNKKLLKQCEQYKKTAKKQKCDLDEYLNSVVLKKKLSFIFIYFYF